jgi:Protein of unknown function (DUF4235)
MKFLFMPLRIAGGLIAGSLSKKVFDAIWGVVDDEEAPEPKHREIPVAKLLAALVLQGAVFRLFRGLFDHYARRGFWKLTGSWPGEERPEPE